jgi:hypothetical protein
VPTWKPEADVYLAQVAVPVNPAVSAASVMDASAVSTPAVGASAGASTGTGAVAIGSGVATSAGGLFASLVGVAAVTASTIKSSDTSTIGNAGTATRLIVADGYLDGAKVFIDMNDNGEVDIGIDVFFGISTNGVVNGHLTDVQKLHGLITSGGTDISTGTVFEGSYTATAGSTVVNPLTTLVHTMVQTALGTGYAAGKSNAEIQALIVEAKSTALTAVNSALGLPTDADLTQIDTVSSSAASSANVAAGISLEQAIEMNSKAMMVANMMAVGAAALKGAVSDSSTAKSSMTELSNFMVQGIVSSINTANAGGG